MKNEQKERAKALFFDTNLTKTEIAEKLNVDRRTIRIWSQEGNWEHLRKSARHLPSMVAEKCYYLIDQYLNSLMINGDVNTYCTLQLKHAQTIHLLATTIKKLIRWIG